MTTRSGHLPVPGFVARDEIDTLFASANPNPARDGCPPPETIRALARHERAIDDAAYEHLGFCSPCYQEFRGAQETAPARGTTIFARRSTWAAVAAACLLVIVGTWWYVRWRSVTTPSEPPVQLARVELDLRPFAVARAPQDRGNLPRPSLPRGPIVLTLLLPTGSEPGTYEAQLRDASGAVVASASGHADIRDFVTTLSLTLDLRSASAGDHLLAIRHEGEDWHLFPVAVR